MNNSIIHLNGEEEKKEDIIMKVHHKIKNFRDEFDIVFNGFNYPVELFLEEEEIWQDQCECALDSINDVIRFLEKTYKYFKESIIWEKLPISKKFDVLFLFNDKVSNLKTLSKKVKAIEKNLIDTSFNNSKGKEIGEQLLDAKNDLILLKDEMSSLMHQIRFLRNSGN